MALTSRHKLWLAIFGILVLALVAGLIDWPQVPSYFPGANFFNQPFFHLGLDLQGGTHLIYQADTSQIEAKDRALAVEGVRDVIERRVNAFGISEPIVQTNKTEKEWRVIVELAGVFDVSKAIKMIGETPLLEFKEQNPEFERPLNEEEQKRLEEENKKIEEKANEILKKVLEKPEEFADFAKEYSEDPGSKDQGGELGWARRGQFIPPFEKAIFDELKVGEITSKLIKSDFGYHIIKKEEERPVKSDETSDHGVKGEGEEKEVRSAHILFRTKTEIDIKGVKDQWKLTGLSGKELKRAQVQFDSQTSEPEVGLEFNSEGKDLFAEITERNVGKPVAIFLDGVPISIPNVQEPIREGRAVITGRFNLKEAKELVQRLNAGALPVPIKLISQTTIGPSLGKVSVEKSLFAGLVGLILVASFMLLYYRLLGLLSVIALAIYGLVVLAFFQIIPVTLTLAGVAGFILSIGMAVDANVLIFERMKEELKAGKELSKAQEEGFKRAWPSIRDSNLSSLLTCFILIWFGTSTIKGFAITLSLGILVSMFTAVAVTRSFLRIFIGTKAERLRWIFGAK